MKLAQFSLNFLIQGNITQHSGFASPNRFFIEMKPQQLYHDMKEVAEKLGVIVSEHNFRTAGIKVKSGLCKVKGKDLFIIDKHKSIHEKNEILASCLSKMQHEDIYIVPAVREFLYKYSS